MLLCGDYAQLLKTLCFSKSWRAISARLAHPRLNLFASVVGSLKDRRAYYMMRDAIWRGVVVCIPLKLRHSKMLGGGFHCVTLDIRRRGTLQRYFD